MQAKINPEFKNLTQQIKNVENEIKQIFDQYYSPLCNYAAKIIGDNTVAEDLVQNLFIQLWEGNKLSGIDNYERFLLRATKFKSIDYLRTQRTHQEVSIDLLPNLVADNVEDLKEEDIEPLLYYYTSKLPPKTREVFLLSRKSGLTYKEIASEMNISAKTVENQMGRALRLMREFLKENEIAIFIIGINIFK